MFAKQEQMFYYLKNNPIAHIHKDGKYMRRKKTFKNINYSKMDPPENLPRKVPMPKFENLTFHFIINLINQCSKEASLSKISKKLFLFQQKGFDLFLD